LGSREFKGGLRDENRKGSPGTPKKRGGWERRSFLAECCSKCTGTKKHKKKKGTEKQQQKKKET